MRFIDSKFLTFLTLNSWLLHLHSKRFSWQDSSNDAQLEEPVNKTVLKKNKNEFIAKKFIGKYVQI